MNSLIEIIRKQEILGLALAFLIGATISKLISSFVGDIVSPLLGIAFQKGGSLAREIIRVGPVRIEWGNFVSTIIEALVVALVIYLVYSYVKRKDTTV